MKWADKEIADSKMKTPCKHDLQNHSFSVSQKNRFGMTWVWVDDKNPTFF